MLTAISDHEAGAALPPRRGAVLVMLVFVVVWGLITHGTYAGSGDEPHYLVIAHSIVFDADIDLTNNYSDAKLIAGGTLEAGAHARPHDGRLRPVHDIGMPIVFAPVVRVAYGVAQVLGDAIPASLLSRARLNTELLFRHQISLAMALLTGLLARELFLTLCALGMARGAFGWSLLFALTPPALSHSFLFFTEIPTALITLFVFRRLSVQPLSSWRMAAVAGALTGFLLLVHARNVGIVAGLGLVAVMMTRRGTWSLRLLAVFGAGLALAALARTLTTFVLWGSLVTTPHAAPGAMPFAREFISEVTVRVTGMLFDREHGLVAYAPVYLLAAPGFLLMRAKYPRVLRDLGFVAGAYLLLVLLPMTNFHGWRGGWSPAARFLLPIAPLIWIGVASYAKAAAGVGRAIVIAFVAIQLVINAVVWQFPKTLWNDGDGLSAFRWTGWLPSWEVAGAAPAFATLVVLACALTYVCSRYVTEELSSRT